ncbi:hypothetical protein RND71_041067 [Anisodus tanguticus]|uniref:Signal peptidase complex subunit 3 n=1 Tax=Anisodus tanguticus TaxID=243964 RepID=A0AAE1QTX3_9SOLA|nr:hypothetical protein RND71_041067 [Anisodus tanguticus]
MHSFGYRANALLTLAITILAFMCAFASFSDNFNSLTPTAEVQVLNINWFQKKPDGDDENGQEYPLAPACQTKADNQFLLEKEHGFIFLYLVDLLNLVAALMVFVFLAAEYETPKNALNQISLWDGIIPTKEHAKFLIHTTNKYRFVDQGSNLRGKGFNLTLHWHVMPKTGKMSADKLVMTGYRLPETYR